MKKEYKGIIREWVKVPCDQGLGYAVRGKTERHPDFPDNEIILTSYAVSYDERDGRLETRNSFYNLVVGDMK